MNPEIGEPPRADRRDHSVSVRGHTWNDPYAWLRDPGYPEVTDEGILSYLRAENEYFEAAFTPHQRLVETIFSEIRSRIKEDDESVPVKDGDWYFAYRYATGEEYPRHYRKPASGGEWELLLDEVALADGEDYFSLGGMDMTEDGRLLAYSVDTEGSERYRMKIADPANRRSAAPYEIPNTIGDPIWLADGRTFLYIELSDEWRPFRVRSHTVGMNPADDPILFEEQDTGFFVDVDLTQDRRFIIIGTGDHVTTEEWIIPADEPTATPKVVLPRRSEHQYEVDHAGEFFYIRTNDTHKNFRIARVPESTILAGASAGVPWPDFIAPSDERYIRGFSVFSRFLVTEERANAVDGIRIVTLEGAGHNGAGAGAGAGAAAGAGAEHLIKFPEPVFRAGLGENPEFDVDTIRVHYESMVTPPTVFDYHVSERRLETRKVQEIPAGYDPTQYRTVRLLARARDGERIPISVVHRADFPVDGSAFLHLTAYGAYGSGTLPRFSISQLSLLDRGFAFAIAHIRGGDEMGYRWYEDGKLFKRTNTFTDFVDCARHLCEEGYTAPGRICASGGSAGGELMGAVVNMAGDLFRAVVAMVPFVDVLNTMLDETLPLTPTEWPEWGNPIESEEAFRYIQSYSPYDNVEAKPYPPLLVTAGLSDPRVTYWEPAKWTAKLRATKTDNTVLLLKTNMGAGHAGKSGRFEHLRETAEYMAFFLVAAGKRK